MSFGKKQLMNEAKYRVLIPSFEQDIIDYANCKISYKKLRAKNYPFELFDAWSKEIQNARKFRNEHIANTRDLQVIYLTGDSGSGKTLTAKWLADNEGLDYFVSGTGDDILDGYDGEPCIILDDYRAATFKFAEFLKFIDKHTNSSVRSRYYNKDISNCVMIIITSIKAPYELYAGQFDSSLNSMADEAYEQLARRLDHTCLWVNKESMSISISHTDKDAPKSFYMDLNDVYKYYNIDPNNNETNRTNNVLAKYGAIAKANIPAKVEITKPKRASDCSFAEWFEQINGRM